MDTLKRNLIEIIDIDNHMPDENTYDIANTETYSDTGQNTYPLCPYCATTLRKVLKTYLCVPKKSKAPLIFYTIKYYDCPHIHIKNNRHIVYFISAEANEYYIE